VPVVHQHPVCYLVPTAQRHKENREPLQIIDFKYIHENAAWESGGSQCAHGKMLIIPVKSHKLMQTTRSINCEAVRNPKRLLVQ